MVKKILLVTAWLSIIIMLWLFFLGQAKIDIKNLIIFILLFLGAVFATAVNDNPKPKKTNTDIYTRSGKN